VRSQINFPRSSRFNSHFPCLWKEHTADFPPALPYRQALDRDAFKQSLIASAVTFFACAKKVTKKAQPILMRRQLSADHFLGQNRRLET